MQSTVKIGLIGLGKMGQNHFRVLSILKLVELVFVYDSDEEKSADFSQRAGIKTFSSLQESLSQDLDAVIICSPTSTHAEYITLASEHVTHIFIEKPMSATLDEAIEINALADAKNLNIQVGFIERFNPTVQQLNNILKTSKKVINIDFTRTNKVARITDVDVICDLMIHDIDLALYLNGPVKKISAHGSTKNDLICFSSAILSHENGKFSRLQASCITEKKNAKNRGNLY